MRALAALLLAAVLLCASPRLQASQTITGAVTDWADWRVRLSLSGGHVIGRDTEVVVGKDRELFHFSIDLKWLFKKLLNASTWRAAARGVADKLKVMHPAYACELAYRQTALDRLMSIAEYHPNPTVRIFQYSLHTAADLAALRAKLVLVYIEQALPDDMTPSINTLLTRKALADSKLGNLVNDDFVFMACDSSHPYARAAMQLLHVSSEGAGGPNTTTDPNTIGPSASYPLLVVLAPHSSAEESGLAQDIVEALSELVLELGRILSLSAPKAAVLPANKVVGVEWGWAKGWKKGTVTVPLQAVASLRLAEDRVSAETLRTFLTTAVSHAAAIQAQQQAERDAGAASDAAQASD